MTPTAGFAWLRTTPSVHPTQQELLRWLPGDALIPSAAATVMHAITIEAPVERVWPWLAQMGSGRAGWYSHDGVDNGGTPSATAILPRLQHVVPGDVFPSLPGEKSAFVVAVAEVNQDLVLTVRGAGGALLASWEFFLLALNPRTTRLLVRGRVSSHWPLGDAAPRTTQLRPMERVYALLGHAPRWLMAPVARLGHGIMQARQLRGIKWRAEAARG